MTRDEPIFSWKASESSIGVIFVAILIVAAVFTVFLGAVDVEFIPPAPESRETMGILRFSDDVLGSEWLRLAEERGPFPGRLGRGEPRILPDIGATSAFSGGRSWSGYQPELRVFESNPDMDGYDLAREGRRFLPRRVFLGEKLKEPVSPPLAASRKPILTPFDSLALRWLPDDLPDFDVNIQGGDLLSASWRFLIRLRPDGTVGDCVSLSGGAEPGLLGTANWLRRVKFKAGEGERWLGLRVEFVNQ